MPKRGITPSQIEAFRAVMLAGSMTAAARDLHTSQPNVSRLISQLERATSFQLFERRAGRLVPTDDGTVFFQEVQRSFVGLERLAEAAESIRNFGSGWLRIAVMANLATGFLPRVVKRFKDRHPQVSLSIHTATSPTVAQWTASQLCDIGIVMSGRDAQGTRVEPLYEIEGVCALPPGHRLASRRTIRPADLRDEPFISFAEEAVTRSLVDKVFANAKIRRAISLETPHGSIICSLVALGLGVSIVNPLVARDILHAGIIVRPFKPAVPYSAVLLFPRHRPRSAIAGRFVEAMREQLAEELAGLTHINSV